jgi:tRNA pseudouridine55 synthase
MKNSKHALKMKSLEGILPINKPTGPTSFSLIAQLRRLTKITKIGHTGTLDPFASGVMLLLLGREYTKQSDQFLNREKEYDGTLHLGLQTDTYDKEGTVTARSEYVPSLEEIQKILLNFQGTFAQIPPMFSAKKIGGKKLYELARKGIILERQSVQVTAVTTLISYAYPFLRIHVRCSKGTYIRSIANDMGLLLGCGAHLSALQRVKNSDFTLSDCCDGARLMEANYNWQQFLRQ